MDTPTPHNALPHNPPLKKELHPKRLFQEKTPPKLCHNETGVSETHVYQATNDQTKDLGHDIDKKARHDDVVHELHK